MTYVECFVAPVKSEKETTYKDFVSNMGAVFKDHGASRVVDGWSADVPAGEVTSFPLAVKLEADEVVAFGWIEWESKSARDKGMEAAMADARMQMDEMPMDGKRMIFGGFDVFSDK